MWNDESDEDLLCSSSEDSSNSFAFFGSLLLRAYALLINYQYAKGTLYAHVRDERGGSFLSFFDVLFLF